MSIRVLLIIPTLVRGGAEKQLTLLATNLRREQFDVHVCTLTQGGPLQADLENEGIPVHAIDKRFKVDPAAYWRLKTHMRQLKPDIVHTWIFAANCYGRQAAFSAGVRSVLAGERCVDRWKVWHELAIDRHLARRTRRIVTNSSAVRDFYTGHGIAADKFTVIPNGIAVRQVPVGFDREAALASLDLPPTVRVIAAIGRLWPQKRVKDLIWAAELLKVIREDTHLLIVGEGPQRWRLEHYRDRMGIQDRVHFVGHRDDVMTWIPALDGLWLASAYEGQSNAVMEAMAAGIPVIATDIPGNRELITSERNGFLVPVGDRAAFARRTHQLLDDATLAKAIGKAAQQTMRDDFGIEQMVDRYAALYLDVAS